MDWKERADVFPLECEYWAGLGFGEEKKEEEEGRGRGREEGEGRGDRGVRRQRKERQEEEGERIWVFCFFLHLLDRKHTIPERPPHVRGAQMSHARIIRGPGRSSQSGSGQTQGPWGLT